MTSLEKSIVASRTPGFPEDSIGRLTTSDYVAIRPEFTVSQAIAYVREHGKACRTINPIYVVDSSEALIGIIRLKDLILAAPEERISEIVISHFASLQALADQELAVRQFQEQDAVALPVVDELGTLLGTITVDDVMDVAEQESLEDFQKFGSLQRPITNPLTARIGRLYRERIVWLFALVFMNVFSGFAISRFESVIQSMVSLVFFLPLLIDSGGNAGAQAATLMIRSLAIGDVQLRNWLTLFGKELLVSFLLGISMAAGVALIVALRAPEIALVVTLTMVASVVLSSLIGLLLPLLLTKLHIDPATASAPLITSIADISGVLIYFSFATWYFGL